MMLLQEGSTVSWDPAMCCYCDRGFWIPDGTQWVLLFSFAIYLCWIPLQWIARWKLARYVLPTVMAVAALIAAGPVLNAAGTIGAGVAALALEDAQVPAWVFGAIATVLGWVGWYMALLAIELRTAPAYIEVSRLQCL